MSLPSRPPRSGAFLSRVGRQVARVSSLVFLAVASALPAQVKVMTNGDSITFGIGASDTTTQSYSAELARLLGSGYYVQKDGTGGATMLKKGNPSFWNTQGIRITSEMNPGIVYIMLGTNDSKSGNWIYRDEYIGDYLALIDLYRALPGKPQIYIGLPPPATASNGDVHGPIVANEVIPRILEVARQRDVKVVDAHTPFLDPFRSLLPDGIHPNDEGHRVIARTIRDAILHGRVWRALPSAWQRSDIGATGFGGGDAIDESNVFQVLGGGATIAGGADAFRFVHQTIGGDTEVTARVLGQRNVDPLQSTRADSAAGVMIRENAAAGSRHVSVIATPGGGVSFRWRDAAGANAGSTVVSGVNQPAWVRVRRSGNTFTGFYSTNGSTWIQIGASRSVSMPSSALVGLAANSAQGNTLTHARFDQVRINGATTTTPTTPTEPSTPTNPDPEPPTTPVSDIAAATAAFDPAATTARTLAGDAYASLVDSARSGWAFATDQVALRPLRAAFPGTARDSLSFDGSRMLPGPLAQTLFTPGVSQDLAMAAVVRIPASGGGGKAVILSINKTDTEPAVALGYDYGQSRFYAVFPHSVNGAPSEIAGATSPRGASYLVRVQKTGGTVRLLVDGKLLAETNASRPAILASGQGAAIGLGGLRPLNPQFVGQVGKFHLRNAALSDTEAATLDADLRAWALGDTSIPVPPTTPPPTTTNPPTTPAPEPVVTSAATFDPSANSARTLTNDTFVAVFDAANNLWRFATDQAAIRPARVAFPGTTRDALSFDGTRMLPGPRAQDLFLAGVTQDMGLAAAVHIPSSGGSGKALILTVNRTDTEPAVALGYDYGQSRFYAVFPQALNGAASEIAGATSPRGASYVVRVQKAGGSVRLFVDGKLLAETSTARAAILAAGQGGPLGLGGIRPLNPQFVGQIGKFYLRNGTLSDSEAATLETDLRTWVTGGATTTPPTTTNPPTTTEPGTVVTAAATFDPTSDAARIVTNNAFAALYDPARAGWDFVAEQAAIRPLRAAFPGTSRDSLSFDGARMLPGPRAQDLFVPGVSRDLGLAMAVRIPASGGSGKALILSINRADTEPAVALGYDYGLARFYVVFPHSFNGAPSEVAGLSSPRGGSYVVRVQKTGATVRLFVNGKLLAETTSARAEVLAAGQGAPIGLGGIRPLNPQFVGQVGKFYLRNAALTDAESATLEADLRAWAGL